MPCLANRYRCQVYLYRGTKDGCYIAGSLAQTLLFYSLFVGRDDNQIACVSAP